MRTNFITILLILLSNILFAQLPINAGSIEYEVKTNVYRQNEGDEWFERFKDQVSQFQTNYYKLQFIDNKTLYKFDRKGDSKQTFSFFGNREDETIWYNNYQDSSFAQMATLEGYLLLNGKQRQTEWKLVPDDRREIAGFNCRKAQTILFDSVYVFVYYTDEIAVSGGPMNLNGLPGMILGVTVPRLFTSWIATSVNLATPNAAQIVPPTKGKKKTEAEIKKDLAGLAKSWGTESKKWLDQMYWRTLL